MRMAEPRVHPRCHGLSLKRRESCHLDAYTYSTFSP
jgi:hypothetical protein